MYVPGHTRHLFFAEAFQEYVEGIGKQRHPAANVDIGNDMCGIESLILCGNFQLPERRIPDAVEKGSHQRHLRVFGGQTTSKLNQGAAGQVIVAFVDIQRLSPANVETEFVQRCLITHVVELLKQAQTQQTGNAEIGTTCFTVKHSVSIFVPEEDGQDFDFEKVRPG